jgi:hypothetical protein
MNIVENMVSALRCRDLIKVVRCSTGFSRGINIQLPGRRYDG